RNRERDLGEARKLAPLVDVDILEDTAGEGQSRLALGEIRAVDTNGESGRDVLELDRLALPELPFARRPAIGPRIAGEIDDVGQSGPIEDAARVVDELAHACVVGRSDEGRLAARELERVVTVSSDIDGKPLGPVLEDQAIAGVLETVVYERRLCLVEGI